MKCREFKKYLGEYVDGELAGSLKNDFEGHLGGCASCRKAYEAVAGAWEALKSVPSIEPSPAFVSRFWTKVAQQGDRKKQLSLAFVFSNLFTKQRWVPAVMVMGVMVLVSLSVTRQMGFLDRLSSADVELIQNMDLAEHFDDINEIEELEDADLIQELDQIQV